MNILLIGDSMIKRLEEHLSEDLDVIFYRGTTIERLTSRISKIKKHYDWILVHVGTNNISVDSVEIILQKYRSLANEILRVNPKARIIFSSIIPRDFNYFENDYWKTVEHIKILKHKIVAVNKALEKLCHNEDAFIFCSSNKPSWSGFLGKDGLHPNKSGDLRLANYFCRFLKKCISSDNASRKRKNCQLITSGYILDSLEFPPLPSCDQPSFSSSWPHGAAVPCSEVPTFVDPVPSYVSSFPSASQKDQKCQSVAPKFILDSTEFPALSSSRQSSFLSSWSKHPASWPLARPSVSACAVSTASCSLPPSPPVPRSLPASLPVPRSLPASLPVPRSLPASLPVPRSLPASLPVPRSLPASLPVPPTLPASLPVPPTLPASLPVPPTLPASLPVPPTGHVQFLIPIVSYMPMVQFVPFHSVAVSYPPFYVPVVPPFLPAAVSSLPTCSQSVVACTLQTHSEPEPARTSPVHSKPEPARTSPVHSEPEPARTSPVHSEPEPARTSPVHSEPEPARASPVHSEPEASRISPAQCRPACPSNKLGKDEYGQGYPVAHFITNDLD
ncbi:uncharacterized protein LOC129981447 [Argiope bruennichi]|uniref:uncharacterized protein LOC129981447 n=1 Tax=Argiope bruennichi TaxID=94029 RepID=UPI0024949E7C|nr:uncharacterized protein LOC129981447 [Argiope bruennichi]